MKILHLSQSRHLEARLGIGVRFSYANHWVGQGLDHAFGRYLPTSLPPVTEPALTPMLELRKNYQHLTQAERQAVNKERRKEGRHLQRWFLQHIYHSEYPLHSRMMLFWHNHFTSSLRSVRWPQLIYRQHLLIREHALGSFADLLRAIWKDSAMLLFLNGQQNSRRQPNENFSRELLELFTLGEGHYTEADILSAAKAFTGWRYQWKNDRVHFNKKRHDSGPKSFLGNQGLLDAEDIIEILLQQPRTAEFICEKFWYEFVSPAKPDRELIQSWAHTFRYSDYNIPSLLQAIVNSDAFWADQNRGSLIKSPIDLVLGLLRELEVDDFSNYQRLLSITKRLGQEVFNPPDVKGWRTGKTWVKSSSLIIRHDFIRKALKEHSKAMMMGDGDLPVKQQQLSRWLLAVDPVITPDSDGTRNEVLAELLLDPGYQLR